MNVRRQVKEGIIHQGEDESISYTLLTTPWGSTPINPAVTIYLHDPVLDTYTDTSLTNLVGAPSVLGDVITCPLVTALVIGNEYRLDIQFTVNGNTVEAFAIIVCER